MYYKMFMSFEKGFQESSFNPDDPEQILADKIPPKCKDCGIQCELGSELVRLLVAKHVVEEEAGGLVGESGDEFDTMVDEQVPMELADEVKRTVRQSASEDLDDIDYAIDEVNREMDSNALACSGILRMRARKGDVSYTVSVCTSSKQYIRDGLSSHIPTHISAKSID